MKRKDYYLILGTSRSDAPAAIRSAYRDLAQRYHPDRAGPEGTRRFQEINEAYEVLSDPEARAAYDQETGGRSTRVPVQAGAPPGRARPPGPARPPRPGPIPEPLIPGPPRPGPAFHERFEERLEPLAGRPQPGRGWMHPGDLLTLLLWMHRR